WPARSPGPGSAGSRSGPGCRNPTALEKITTRCGDGVVAALNAALLVKADAAEAVRTGRARAGTTVAEADGASPADSGLLARAIIRITVLAACIHAAGAASRTQVRDRRRAESPPGPGPGFPADPAARRPGWCPCTTRTPGRPGRPGPGKPAGPGCRARVTGNA